MNSYFHGMTGFLSSRLAGFKYYGPLCADEERRGLPVCAAGVRLMREAGAGRDRNDFRNCGRRALRVVAGAVVALTLSTGPLHAALPGYVGLFPSKTPAEDASAWLPGDGAAAVKPGTSAAEEMQGPQRATAVRLHTP